MRYCNLIYYNDLLKPSSNQIIISCSIFKLVSMYQDVSIYLKGLVRLIKFTIKDPRLYLIVYYDHSIETDIIFSKIIKRYNESVCKERGSLPRLGISAEIPNVQFCKYYCKKFIDDNGLHKGVFGMFVRFLPYFDERLRLNLKFITDIDLHL